jgi:hypothetical protein
VGEYASKTTVPPEKSRMEIEQTIRRYGAEAFAYGYEGRRAVVTFRAEGRYVRFEIEVPQMEDFRVVPKGARNAFGRRTDKEAENHRAQAERQRWRALLLVIKAKLEAVDAGIVSFEEEFLAHILLPNGETVGKFMAPQVEEAYAKGVMPSMLPALPRGD